MDVEKREYNDNNERTNERTKQKKKHIEVYEISGKEEKKCSIIAEKLQQPGEQN